MRHSDPELLSMVALNEADLPDDDAAHLRACAVCRRELAALQRITRIARDDVSYEVESAMPSDAVWSRVSAELGFSPELHPAPFESGPSHAVRVAGTDTGTLTLVPSEAPDLLDHEPGGRHASPRSGHRGAHLARRRRRRAVVLAVSAAAAVVAVVGIVGIVVVRSEPAPAVVARGTLDAFPNWQGSSGRAQVDRLSNGTRDLVLSVDVDHRVDGYREVWLMSSNGKRLVSLGALDGSRGTYAVPDDVNLADYPLVDVSAEPLDGNPAHSGNSIVRGPLSGPAISGKA